MNRRGFIMGAASLLAAPVIVRCASLMPVRSRPVDAALNWANSVDLPYTYHQVGGQTIISLDDYSREMLAKNIEGLITLTGRVEEMKI